MVDNLKPTETLLSKGQSSLKKLGHGITESIAGGTTRVKDLYHDAGAKVTELKNNIKDTLEHDIHCTHKKENLFLGVPYHYYSAALILCYAWSYRDRILYNTKMFAGVIFMVAGAGRFVRWNIRSYMKQHHSKNSKEKNFEAY